MNQTLVPFKGKGSGLQGIHPINARLRPTSHSA